MLSRANESQWNAESDLPPNNPDQLLTSLSAITHADFNRKYNLTGAHNVDVIQYAYSHSYVSRNAS